MAGFAETIKNWFKGLLGQEKKQTPDTAMALEILTLVQEALDSRDDPEALTLALGRIQQLANNALGESTRLLTGPKSEEKPIELAENIEDLETIAEEDVETVTETVKSETDLPEDAAQPENISPEKPVAEEQSEEMEEDVITPEEADSIEPEEAAESVETAELADEETPTAAATDEIAQEVSDVIVSDEKAEESDEQTETEAEAVETESNSVNTEEEAPAELEATPIHPERFAGKRVLYAYGNASEYGLIRQTCDAWEIVIDIVPNGLTAVKQFSASEAQTYDAIILEKSMPLMNGFMAAKCIRKDKHEESETIPIIVAAFGSQTGQQDKEAEWVSACMCEATEQAIYDALDAVWPESDDR